MAMLMLCTSCDCSTSLESDSQVFRILPRSGMIAWVTAVARLLGGAAGRIALDQEQLAALGILAHAVGELARQRCARARALALDLLAVLDALLRLGDRQHGDLLALIGVLVEPERERVLDDALDDTRRLARGELLLGLAGELRLAHLHGQHEAHAVPHILGRELQTARHEVAELAELAHRIRGAHAQTVDVRAALGGRDQVDVALGDALLGLEHPGERPVERCRPRCRACRRRSPRAAIRPCRAARPGIRAGRRCRASRPSRR